MHSSCSLLGVGQMGQDRNICPSSKQPKDKKCQEASPLSRPPGKPRVPYPMGRSLQRPSDMALAGWWDTSGKGHASISHTCPCRGIVEQCPRVQRLLVGWLWGGDPAAAADPQRTAVAMHLTRSHLSHGSRQQTSPRVDLQSPMASSPRSFWPGPRRLWLASGSALSAVFEQQVSVQPGFLGSPDESVGPSPPSHDHRWARI